MSSSEEGGSEDERALIPVEDLVLAAEREGFLGKQNARPARTSVFYEDPADQAHSIVEEIMETLGEEQLVDESADGELDPSDAVALYSTSAVMIDFDSSPAVSDAPMIQVEESSNFQSAQNASSSLRSPHHGDENDPEYQPSVDGDEDSDESDLVAVPESREVPPKPLVVVIQSHPRRRASKGQRSVSKREEAKRKREQGEGYMGFRRIRENTGPLKTIMAQDNPRNPKEMGPPCNSRKCLVWSTRHCSTVTYEERAELFSLFWKKMDWPTKKMFICSLVYIQRKKSEQKLDDGKESRRSFTFLYHLKIGERKVQVCKQMFLNTFGLGEMSVRHWLNNFQSNSVPHKLDVQSQNLSETLSDDETPRSKRALSSKRGNFLEAENHLKDYLDGMPKLPSHYMRKDSRKMYLEADITSAAQLYRLYEQHCRENEVPSVSRFTFDRMYKKMNIGIFNPRKDQCDVCCGFQTGNVSADVHERHIMLKEQARKEKERDKERAIAGEIHVITCDMMAVQVMPQLLASASYYKLKLHVHNYTIFNLANRDAKCYWWDESVASLDASIYASCLVEYIEELLKTSPKKDVIIFSDGCTAQNRNSILSNALLHTSMKHGIMIIQKFLEKGHTQMEVDSVHSHIEAKMKKSEMYLPHHFIQKTVEARVDGGPYRATYLNFDFFVDYGAEDNMIYSSIRPGNSKGDPVVTDLRWIQYEPQGEIKFKVNFNDDVQPLPRRPRIKKGSTNFKKMYQQIRPITYDQYKDLLFLAENLLPKDCVPYYKALPHQETSIRSEKKKEANLQKKKKKTGNEEEVKVPSKKAKKFVK